jgi:aminoglycoside 3-N-acetyltransferase
MHKREKLAQNLRNLGVEAGDILFMHSSFKSLGAVEGGAGSVIGAMEDAVGPEGLILLPSFHLIERHRRAEVWDFENTPSTVGWLTDFFRTMPGTYRSDHYSHSVAARGKGAAEFVGDHLSRAGLRSPWDREPWGKTFGTDSPMYRAYQRDGKLLMIGVDYETSTYIHLVEVLHWNKLLEQAPEVRYPALRRPLLGAFWDRVGTLNRGLVGDAQCRLFRIQEYLHTLVEEVEKNGVPYLQ